MTTDSKTIQHELFTVLNRHVPTAIYLNAENIARHTEAEYGTLTDLRDQRDRVLRSLNELAEEIEKLKCEVRAVTASRREASDLFEALSQTMAPFPSIRKERFPADDEQR